MPVRIQLRGGPAADWTSADPTLALREPGLETDTKKFKFGDGVTAWTSLPYSTADITEILDLPTAETDTALVLAPDGSGGVEFRAETGGGAVDSVNAQTGVVVLDAGDVGADVAGAAASAQAAAEAYADGLVGVEVDDGTTDVTHVTKINVPAGTLTDDTGGEVTLTATGVVVSDDTPLGEDSAGDEGTSPDASRSDHVHPFVNPIQRSTIATPGSPPPSGETFLYPKADGRWYSMDDMGVETGPFEPAGAGGLYVVDETFPGVALPPGWTFTGAGSCVVAGGVAAVTGGGQSDRLMFAYTPPASGISVIRAHVQNLSGEGGMPSLVALDAGNGLGTGPYNDGNWYAWTINGTAYQYSGTNVLVDASPAFPGITDVYFSLLVIDGQICGGGFSTDGVTWTGLPFLQVASFAITEVGICQLFNSADSDYELVEFTITEP